MKKLTTFILTVASTLVSAIALIQPSIGFREDLSLGKIYLGGILVGGLLVVLWISVIYLWTKMNSTS